MDADFVANPPGDWDITNSDRYRDGPVAPSVLSDYDATRYEGWSFDRVITTLRGSVLGLLKRGTLATLIARRECGGLLVAASKLVTTLAEQTSLFRRVLDLDYSDARRHMKLWVHWPRVAKMLRDREESCQKSAVFRSSYRAIVAAYDWPGSPAEWGQPFRLIRHRHSFSVIRCRLMLQPSWRWSRRWNSRTA